ncbi:MAG: homoserine O-acetyltransferase [Bacteroidota bacterium]
MNKNYFKYEEEFHLENGEYLDGFQLAYHTFGKRNSDDSNIVWVYHAISANSDVLEWWPGLFGADKLYDPQNYFIICVNTLCSPYGSTSPPDESFPLVSIRDVVKSQLLLADALQISHIHTCIGGSFGGNQALEFSYQFHGQIDHLILMVSTFRESAYSIATHEAQRIAMKADSTFGQRGGGQEGMKAARAFALINYRTHDAFVEQQTDFEEKIDQFKAASYIQYQGDKFVDRFDSLCYYYLTKCLDTFHFSRGRGNLKKALQAIKMPTLVLGIDSDILIPTRFQKQLASLIPNAIYEEIDSDFGHDGFLVETDKIKKKILNFYIFANQSIERLNRQKTILQAPI